MGLIEFSGRSGFRVDGSEAFSNFLLTPLRTAIGETYRILDENSPVQYSVLRTSDAITRLVAGIFSLAILPLTLLGLALAASSQTYNDLANRISAGAARPRPNRSKRPTGPPPPPRPFKNIQTLPIVQYRKPATELDSQTVAERMQQMTVAMHQNFLQVATDNDPTFDHKQFNLDMFRTMQGKGHQTPMDFCLGFSGFNVPRDPQPRVHNPIVMETPEGRFFEICEFGQVKIDVIPVHADGHIDGRSVVPGNAFGRAFRKVGKEIHVFMDGISQGSTLRVNDQVYPYIYGRGASEPSVKLVEGDHIYSSYKYLGRVDADGNIERPSGDPGVLETIPEGGKEQSERLLANLCDKSHKGACQQLTYTNLRVAEELSEPLEAGFVVPNSYSTEYLSALESGEKNALMVFEPDRDPIFNKLVAYFKKEKEVLGLSDKELILRLTSFLIFAFEKTPYSVDQLTVATFGDCLNARTGVCRHRAFFLKAMLDAVGIDSTIIIGGVRGSIPIRMNGEIVGWGWAQDKANSYLTSGHAWNGIEIDEERWLIDPMAERAFPIREVPGEDGKACQRLERYYGLGRAE
jgi:hypothetical protein